MERRCVVGLGEILWDLLPGGKELGGAPANFAYHAQALGAQGNVVSCVGNDPLGDEILRCLDEAGLDKSHVAVHSHYPTGTVSVTLGDNGIPSYVIHADVAWDYILWSDKLPSLAAGAAAACFGSLGQRSAVSRRTVERFLRGMPDASLRVFDVNLRQSFYCREVIHGSCELCNVIKLNDEELPVIAELLGLSGSGTVELMRELVEKYSLRLAALTRGSHGSVLCTPERISEHEGYPAVVADTVGAGDSFTAAVVIGMLDGYELDCINDAANRLAAAVCSKNGAMPRGIHSDIYEGFGGTNEVI